MATASRSQRFVLWIDAVGGYLVCTGTKVTIGQALPGNPVDVAIQGDVSRRHVVVSRHGEGYVLEPVQPVRIGGQRIASPVNLTDGDVIELGGSVRMQFRKPHALSGSASLQMLSRHRTQPLVDGVLLMAESCVLGPSATNHVVCRQWEHDLVLFRRDEQLHCRASKSLEINGQRGSGVIPLNGNSRIVGEDFSLSVEHLA
ncbi:MAG: FHA domain-containing protein [Pirellulales bacterium]